MGRSEHPFLIKWFVMLFYPGGQERRMYSCFSSYEGFNPDASRDDLALTWAL